MNFAYVVDRFPVLSETFVISQITGLIDRGHNVDVYAKALHAPGVTQPDVTRYELIARSHFWPDLPASKPLRFARALRLWFGALRTRGATALRAADAFHYGIEAVNGNLAYASSRIPAPRAYDAIHAHFGNVGVRAQGLRDLGRLRGPLVTTFHGFDLSFGVRGSRLSRLLVGYGALFSRGDLFLPVSERWRRRLIELGCPADRVVVHRMGIDVARFACARLARPSGPLRLISVARLVEKKGIAVALDAVRRLAASGTALEYTIVGDGPLRAALEAQAQSSNAANIVRFTGAQPHSRVAELMAEADLLLAPSVVAANGDEEGLPVVIMEAMASGLVVIATNHSGIPELVVDGSNGFLAPERDAAALAAVIAKAAADRDRWPAIRSTARQAVEAQHDITKLNDRLVELLATAGRGRAPYAEASYHGKRPE